MQVKGYAIQCIKDEAQAVLDLIPQLDENFDKAVDLMYNCKGKVIVTGVGIKQFGTNRRTATLHSDATTHAGANNRHEQQSRVTIG